MKNTMRKILLAASFLSTSVFAGQQGGNGTPPAKTLENLLDQIDSKDLAKANIELNLDFTVSPEELQKIVGSGLSGSDSAEIVSTFTKDGKKIPLVPTKFEFKSGILSVEVGARTLTIQKTVENEDHTPVP